MAPLPTVSFYVGHCVLVASIAVRDIFWLRTLAILAGILIVPYFIFTGPDEGIRADPLFWQTVYVTIHAVNLARLVHERRDVRLSPEEERLRLLVFRTLRPRELLKLLAIAQWRDVEPGHRVTARGQALDELTLICHGACEVRVDDRVVATLRDGQFIGEMAYVSGRPASADAVAVAPTRLVVWAHGPLRALLNRKPQMQRVVEAVLGVDMVEKLTVKAAGDGAR